MSILIGTQMIIYVISFGGIGVPDTAFACVRNCTTSKQIDKALHGTLTASLLHVQSIMMMLIYGSLCFSPHPTVRKVKADGYRPGAQLPRLELPFFRTILVLHEAFPWTITIQRSSLFLHLQGLVNVPFGDFFHITKTNVCGDEISPIVGWCLIRTFTNPWSTLMWTPTKGWTYLQISSNSVVILWDAKTLSQIEQGQALCTWRAVSDVFPNLYTHALPKTVPDFFLGYSPNLVPNYFVAAPATHNEPPLEVGSQAVVSVFSAGEPWEARRRELVVSENGEATIQNRHDAGIK